MLMTDFLDRVYIVFRPVTPSTHEQFRVAIGHLEQLIGRKPDLADLSDETFAALTGRLMAMGSARATVNKYLRLLLSLARFAKRRKLTTYMPDVEKVPEKRQKPTSWNIQQLGRLIEEAANLPVWGPTLNALLLVYYDTGIRMRDALTIPRAALEGRRLVVDEAKTGKRRVFTLHPTTLAVVLELPQDGERLIPYRFVTVTPLRKALRKALDAAGLPKTRKDLFQKIRRTAATQCAAAGEDATAFLGHSAPWVTRTFYVDQSAMPATDMASKMPRPGRPLA